MVEVERDILRSTHLLQQNHLQQVAEVVSRWIVKISKEGNLTTPLGNLAASQKKSFFTFIHCKLF